MVSGTNDRDKSIVYPLPIQMRHNDIVESSGGLSSYSFFILNRERTLLSQQLFAEVMYAFSLVGTNIECFVLQTPTGVCSSERPTLQRERLKRQVREV